MIFDSTIFLFAFFPIALILYYVTPGRFKNVSLVFLSIVFYAWGEPVHLAVLIVSIGWNYLGALAVAGKRKNSRKRKNMMLIVTGGDVILLGICKYAGRILELAGNELAENRYFLVPVGVSFFMLQNIAYIIDVYREDVKVQKNIINFAALIAMFPKIAAGPLVSCGKLEEQLKKRKFSWGRFSDGVLMFVRGLSKKVILGSGLWRLFQTIFALPSSQMSAASAWLGCFAFAFQIYFAFGGYCDMALGLGKMFGFELPQNVDHPFLSTGIMDFWSRWMSTLWKWFCSYIYLPLCGGNPAGRMGFLSLLATWILIGLWHGLNTSFVIWGIYFAVLLYLEGFVLGDKLSKLPGVIRWFFTMLFLMAGWALFFNPSAGKGVSYLGLMAGIGGSGFIDSKAVDLIADYGVLWFLAVLFSMPLTHRAYEWLLYGRERWKTVLNCIAYIGMFFLCVAAVVAGSGYESFYFRF